MSNQQLNNKLTRLAKINTNQPIPPKNDPEPKTGEKIVEGEKELDLNQIELKLENKMSDKYIDQPIMVNPTLVKTISFKTNNKLLEPVTNTDLDFEDCGQEQEFDANSRNRLSSVNPLRMSFPLNDQPISTDDENSRREFNRILHQKNINGEESPIHNQLVNKLNQPTNSIRKTKRTDIYNDEFVQVQARPHSMPQLKRNNSITNFRDFNNSPTQNARNQNPFGALGLIRAPSTTSQYARNQLQDMDELAQRQNHQMLQGEINALQNVSNLRNKIHQSADTIKMIRRQFIEDSVITLYLFISIFLSPKDENYEPQCQVKLGSRVGLYYTYIQMPMFCFVALAYYMVQCQGSCSEKRKRNLRQNQQRAFKLIVLKYIWLLIGMTVWTIHTVILLVDIGKECFEKSRLIVIINFFIIGVIGSVFATMMLVILVCCFPMVIRSLREIREFFLEGFDFTALGQNSDRLQNNNSSRPERRRNQRSELVQRIINACVNRKFTPDLFEEAPEDCIICMEKFEEGQCDITPLSHNHNHFFHTHCLEEWLKRNAVCPICRTPINAEEEAKFREEYELQNQNAIPNPNS